MKTSEAVERLNKDPKDAEARKALRQKLNGMTALYVKDGKIHLAETLEALEHCEETGEPAPECVSFDEWEAENATERRACPITGRALMNGKLRVERADLPPIAALTDGDQQDAIAEDIQTISVPAERI